MTLNHISPFSSGLPSPKSCFSGVNSANSDEDHGQLTAALDDKLDEALERGQCFGVEIVRVFDEQRERPFGLAEQLLQIAFAPFRLGGCRGGLLQRQIIEQCRDQQRQRYLGLLPTERTWHDHAPLALQFLAQSPRQYGLTRADGGGERDQASAPDRSLQIMEELGMMRGLK